MTARALTRWLAESRAAWKWLLPVEAASFFVGALLHAGVAIGPFNEPTVAPAVIVESLCGAALVIACGVFLALRERRGSQIMHTLAIDAGQKV